MQRNRNAMWFMPRQLLLLAALLFVTAVQAAPNDPPTPGEGQVASAPAPQPHSSNVDSQPGKNTHVKGDMRSGSRYGIGYEARHGIDAGARSDRGDRMERPERPEHMERVERVERPERAERDGRGR